MLSLVTGAAQAVDEVHAHEHEHERKKHPESERIVVTATPLEHSSDELASPIVTLHRDDIIESLGTTIGETLASTPGITTSGFARGASRPIIRGQDAYRTEVLEDGLPIQDVSRLSPDHGVPLNPLSARAIEIVRGPATLRYGGGAVGGVVNTLTHRVPAVPNPETKAELYSGFESNGNEGVVAASVDTGIGDFAFHFDGLYRNADDFQTGGGRSGPHTQPGSHAESAAGSFGASWIGESNRVGIAYAHFRSDYGIPESGEDVGVEMTTHRFRAEADWIEPLPGVTEVRFRAAYTDYGHEELANGVVNQTFDSDAFQARFEFIHGEVAGFSGALGIDTRRRDFAAGGTASEFLAPTQMHSTAVYLFEERAISEWLHAELGARIESTSLRGAPDPPGASRRTVKLTPLSGSLGFVAHATDEWTIGLRGATSQRAPSQAELFARGPHEATGTFEYGDPNLGAETAFTGEVRIGRVGDRNRLDIASFVTRYEDYVFGRTTGLSIVVGSEGFDELRYEAHDALFYGGEVAGNLLLFDYAGFAVSADAQIDWVRARFARRIGGIDRDVPRITPVRWGGGISIEGASGRARADFLRTEQQSNTAAGETNTDDFTLLSLSAAYSLVLGDSLEIELLLEAKNLLDVSARNHVAFNKNEVRQPGRSFRVGLRGRF